MQARANALEDARSHIAQVVRVQKAQADLVRADAAVTNGFLAGGLEPVALTARVRRRGRRGGPAARRRLGRAARRRRQARAGQPAARRLHPPDRARPRQQPARACRSARATSCSARRRCCATSSSRCWRRRHRTTARRSTTRTRPSSAAKWWFALGVVVSAGVLVGTQLWLARRTHRVLNVGLVAASAAALLAIGAGGVVLSSTGSHRPGRAHHLLRGDERPDHRAGGRLLRQGPGEPHAGQAGRRWRRTRTQWQAQAKVIGDGAGPGPAGRRGRRRRTRRAGRPGRRPTRSSVPSTTAGTGRRRSGSRPGRRRPRAPGGGEGRPRTSGSARSSARSTRSSTPQAAVGLGRPRHRVGPAPVRRLERARARHPRGGRRGGRHLAAAGGVPMTTRPIATRTTAPRRAALITALATAGALALGACGAPSVPADTPAFTASPAAAPTPLARPTCTDATTSYDPLPATSGAAAFPADSLQAQIRKRGRLVVGVSGDSLLLGSRDPKNPRRLHRLRHRPGEGRRAGHLRRRRRPQGAVPRHHRGAAGPAGQRGGRQGRGRHGRPQHDDELRPLGAGRLLGRLPQRRAALPRPEGLRGQEHRRARRGQGPGLRAGGFDEHPADGRPEVRGRRARPGRPAHDLPRAAPAGQGRRDHRRLDGARRSQAQDPQYTEVLDGQIGEEPYGLAVAKGHPEFARYLNAVLEEYISSGQWQASYDKYFACSPRCQAAPDPAVRAEDPGSVTVRRRTAPLPARAPGPAASPWPRPPRAGSASPSRPRS